MKNWFYSFNEQFKICKRRASSKQPTQAEEKRQEQKQKLKLER